MRIKTETPIIDGKLNDLIWKKAISSSGFHQRTPHQGNTATEKTSFQVAYDNNALYFAIICHDQKAEKIRTRLGRRDSRLKSDHVSVHLDTYHGHHASYEFSVYASGVKRDAIYTEDIGEDDRTWDAVWNVETKINEHGWQAEFRIPFHATRFNQSENHTWGLNIIRYISRKNESCFWALIKREDSGWASGFGHLVNIQDIEPSKHIVVLPYLMNGLNYQSQSITSIRQLGGNMIYGLTSGITISATFNPDFGQVEADPAELNLSVFESYFEERRPFFVEGSDIFQTGQHPKIFYSRRIGKSPDYFKLEGKTDTYQRPEATTILSAAKITGQTQSNTNFGFLSAVTAPEYAYANRNNNERLLIEPLTNYLVGRLKQDILSGNSYVGGIATSVNRRNAPPAYVQGFDWNVKFPNGGEYLNQYQFKGLFSTSQKRQLKRGQNGMFARAALGKRKGWYTWKLISETISPDYDVNDLGFNDVRPAGVYYLGFDSHFNRNKPIGPFLRIATGINGWVDWNYDGQHISSGSDLILDMELENFWRIGWVIARDYPGLNEDWGVQLLQPSAWGFDFFFNTDNRKTITFAFESRFWQRDDRSSSEKALQFSAGIKLTDNTMLSLEPNYNQRFSSSQWIDEIQIEGEKQYLFAELDSQSFDFATRMNTSFSPNLSLEFFLQPFVAASNYTNYKTLLAPLTYQFVPLSFDKKYLPEKQNFYYRSIRSNFVIRWEYQPGSSLFFVWTQYRQAENKQAENSQLNPLKEFIRSFSDLGDHLLLIKVNYWLGI